MSGIYVEVGDCLQLSEKCAGEKKRMRVKCVEQAGCNGCYFRPFNCESLECSRNDRLDGKSVIFVRVNEEGGAE